MLEITDTGLVYERLDEIISRLSSGFFEIYGQDINISPDTPDGQIIGLFSQGIADINEVMAGIYGLSDPIKATGTWLDIQMKYAGLTRNKPEFSYVDDVLFNVDIGTIISTGYTFTDKNNVAWTVVRGTTATATNTHMQIRSVETGAFSLPPDSELIPKTVILGVHSIKTVSKSREGRLQESDAAALYRFMKSYSINNFGDREGIEAKILALNDVRDAKVYENYTGSIDGNGVNPHTINSVVIGGDDKQIAETIIKNKSLGCGVQGAVSVTIFYQGMDREVLFDRSEEVKIKAKVTVIRRSAAIDVDEDSIKKSISSDSFVIAEDIVSGSLYCGANNGNYKVKSILLSTDTITDALIIPIGLRQHGSISYDDVEVVVE